MYFGDSHFTARVIYNNGMIWFYDGLKTGHKLIYEGMLNDCVSLNQCKGMDAIAALYVKC